MILVTGGSGILGSQIIRGLQTDNKAVRAIKRSTSDISWTSDINGDIQWIESDILDIIGLDKAFEDITHVIHCAAVVSFDNSNDLQMNNVNIEGTKNILVLCQKYNIQKLIYISSVAALGRSSNADIITEDAKWESSDLNTAYANSKYLAELEVWRAQEEGLATVILNPSVIIGPGNWNNSSINLFKHVNEGNPLYPIGSLNFVDVRDVVNIAIKFLSNNVHSERFILNAGMLSYKSFFGLVANAMHKKAPFLKVNPSLAVFVAAVLRIVKFFTGIKSNITKEAVLMSQLRILFSADKVEKQLNYKFRSVEESVHWTCEQLKKQSVQKLMRLALLHTYLYFHIIL